MFLPAVLFVRCLWPLNRVDWCGRPLCCMGGVPGPLAIVHRASACCIGCAVSLAPWCLFTGVRAQCIMCAVSLASLRLFTAGRAWCVVCAVSLATWRLSSGVSAQCVMFAVSEASWRLFIGEHARSFVSAGSLAFYRLFTGVHALCTMELHLKKQEPPHQCGRKESVIRTCLRKAFACY